MCNEGTDKTQEVVLSCACPRTDGSYSAFDNSLGIFLRKNLCNFRYRRFTIERFLFVWAVGSFSKEGAFVLHDKVARFCYSVERKLLVDEREWELLVTVGKGIKLAL